MNMRAMAVPAPGAGLRMEEREIPAPGPGEVLVRVHACGVCHGDALVVEGHMPGLAYPRIPGHEVIGRIEAVGDRVRGWDVGMRVGVGWFPGACGHCGNCRRGDSFACDTVYGATGITRDGGYATHMLADASAIAHVPDDLDSVEAAPLLCAGTTTFTALRDSGARPGDLVAIHGVGGLGHVAIQFAARQGFRTVAINRGRDKEALALKLGAHSYIDSEAEDAAAALQAMGGARAIVATVTSAEAMQAVAGGLGVNGVMVIAGAVPALTLDAFHLMARRASVKGWYAGTAADSEDTLRFSDLHGVSSMNERFALEDAQAAYDHMMSGKARFRVVLTID